MIELNGILTQLRELQDGDVEDMITLRNNPEYNRFLSNAGQVIKAEDQRNWQRKTKAEGDNYNFAILLNGKFTGTCSVYDIHEGEAEFGRYIVTHPIAAIESEYLSLKFAFEQLGLKSIVCKTVKDNEKVWKQHFRLGFKEVGADFDERIQKARILQVLTVEDFRQFDYEPLLSVIRKLKK